MEDTIAKDTGVVDHAIDATKVVDRRLDDAFGALRLGNAVPVRNRHAAGLADLADDLLRHAEVAAVALGGAAEIIDHHLAALRRRQQGDLAADAAAGAGHDDDFTFNALAGHLDVSSCSRCRGIGPERCVRGRDPGKGLALELARARVRRQDQAPHPTPGFSAPWPSAPLS